ncbi:MAG: transcription termination/antitermination protein NusG [Candidatus Omnitrophota bacterium]|nr:transcription termination/antitermination protein NusG [Candidatus Omnitrophota bacterium]
MAKKWYVLHTLTGKESTVKKALENRLENDPGKKKYIGSILIPTEKVAEVRQGEKKISERKFFPGYLLIEMEINDKSWYLVKDTPGVTGFVGTRTRPVPLAEEEIEEILKQTKEAKEKPVPKVMFDQGEAVRVKDGPFKNFNGTIEETNLEKGKIKVMISIFGRPTPVELETWQIEKI